MKHHSIADLFPMLATAELRQLADDIKANGLREPVVIFDGKILDGRNRHAACIIAKVNPEMVEFSGYDPLAYVISKNLHRRHLDASQRAMVAAKLANLPRGVNQHASKDASSVSQSEAARLLNVSRPSVQRARQVLEHGTSGQIEAVERGESTVSAVAKTVRPPVVPYSQKPVFSSGLMLAERAIEALERINPKDTQREKGLRLVFNWVAHEISQLKKS